MNTIKEYIHNMILEKHLVKEIFEMKKHMEWQDFIKSYDGDWGCITFSRRMSEEFMREFSHKIRWKCLPYVNNPLSESFMRDFAEYLDWEQISEYQELSSEFMIEQQDRIHWDIISWAQDLSESFMRDQQDKVNWENISESQRLSNSFIIEFHSKINQSS